MSEGEQMSKTHDCGGDAAAYVLGALSPAEAREFRRHLEQCAVCRDEVQALRGVAQALPMAAPQFEVPRRLRRRVMRAVRNEPRSLSARAPARLRWRPALAGALAALALVVIVITIASGGAGSGRTIRAQLVGISGSVELHVTGARAELVVRHLPAPPAGHVYEVWLKAPRAAPVPASVLFSVGPNGSADVGIPRSVRGISQVMVTPEPAGGSPAPTHAPVIIAQLT